MHTSRAISIILIPGGWHTAFHLGPIIDSLERIYHATTVIPKGEGEYNDQLRQSLATWFSREPRPSNRHTRPSTNGTSNDVPTYRLIPCPLYAAGPKQERHATFQDDIDIIYNLIHSEVQEGDREICIVAHSAAGIAALGAINKFLNADPPGSAQRISHLICISALCGGRNNGTKAGEEAGWVRIDSVTDLMHVHQTERYFYSDMSFEDATPFSVALVPHVRGEAATRAELLDSEAFRSIPNKTYIKCMQDAIVPLDYQDMQAKDHDMDVIQLDAGHCPFISKPDEFARSLHDIISTGN